MLEQALKLALVRKATLESGVLSHPPKTLEDLQFLVGRYHEVCNLIQDIEDILKGKEDE